MDIHITNHARRRFSERFAHLDQPIEHILKNSQPHGIWTDSTKVYANLEHEVVFVVGIHKTNKNLALVTVVTLAQYTANAQQNFTTHVRLGEKEKPASLPQHIVKIEPVEKSKDQPKPLREDEDLVNELKSLAAKIAAERNYQFFEKEFFENNGWKEFNMSKKKFEIFYAEYCMICRNVKNLKF